MITRPPTSGARPAAAGLDASLTPRPASAVPPGTRVYAVGDIHGRADLLGELVGKIAEDARSSAAPRKLIIFLGDYVDRGLHSREVIDLVLDGLPSGFEAVALKGNHEDFMLRFIEDARIGPGWLMNGGGATLVSYGARMPRRGSDMERLDELRRQLRDNLPDRHLQFLHALRRWHVEGDYLFVHAGIRPGIALDEQRDEDILWIREEFLLDNGDHGKIVVHGHTIATAPEMRPNRIGIDTGAYATGVLTSLVLEGAERGFLQTAG